MANLIELYDKWKNEQPQETLEEHYKKLKELEDNRKMMEFRVKRMNKELGENSNYEYVIIDWDDAPYMVLREKEKK